MAISFASVCDLFEQLSPPRRATRAVTRDPQVIVRTWFNDNRRRIDQTDPVALLSTLLPEQRTDRVYCIQEVRLVKAIAVALLIGPPRQRELSRYAQPG